MDSTDYVSVGDLLARASAELEVGQMVQASNFNLFEAMSAIEIGNVKMDPGAVPKAAAPAEPQPLQTSPSVEAMIAIMDKIISLEATWHSGASLAQTVYCTQYMLQQSRLKDCPPLAAFCQAVEVLCLETNNLVYNGCVCEEEDFNIHTAGLPLERTALTTSNSSNSSSGKPTATMITAPVTAPGSPPGLLDKVVAAVNQAADALTSQQKQPSGAAAAAAVASRLQLHKLLLQALVRMKQRSRHDLDAAAKLLQKARRELEAVKASAGLAATGQSVDLAFDSGVNSHLTPAVPLRLVEYQTPAQAFDHFDRLLQQLLQVCSVTNVTSWPALRAFLEAFSSSRPHSLARSALFLQLNTNPPPAPATTTSSSSAAAPAVGDKQAVASTQHSAPSPAGQAEGATWLPGEVLLRGAVGLEQGVELGQDVDTFFEQAQIAVSNYCQAMLMNRCRCRRRLRRTLEDWHNLYHHGVNADLSPALMAYLEGRGWGWGEGQPADVQGPLATWVEAEMCNIMTWHLLLGFELELYEPADFVMVCWYSEYLCSIQTQDRNQLQAAKGRAAKAATAAGAAAAAAAAAAAGGAGGKKSKGGKAAAGLPSLGAKKGGKGATAAGSKGKAAAAAPEASSPAAGAGGADASAGGGGEPAAAWVSAAAATKAAEQLTAQLQDPHQLHHSLLSDAYRSMCYGLVRLVLALQQGGQLALPQLHFNSPQQRFDQRFGSFYGLARPDPLAYEQFVESTSLEGVVGAQLLQMAVAAFGQARQACQFLKSRLAATQPQPAAAPQQQQRQQQLVESLSALERVAGQNAVAAGLLARTGGAGMAAQFSFQHHPWFPAVVLKSGGSGSST